MTDEQIFIVLAAGKGSRMQSSKAKVMHEIAFRPMIFYSLTLAHKFGNGVNLISHPEFDDLQKYVKQEFPLTNFLYQEERLGTGHAVKIALPKISADNYVYIIYGDTPFIKDEIITSLKQRLDDGYGLALVGFSADPGKEYGRLITDQNKLLAIVENSEASDVEKQISLYNSGIMAVRGEHLLKYIPQLNNDNSKGEFFLTDLIDLLVKNSISTSYITCSEEDVLGVNSKSELALANHVKQSELRNLALNQGVTLIDPSSVFLNPEIKFGKDVIIEPNVVIKGKVELDDGVEIKAFSILENDIKIGNQTKIGPYARIRPNSIIGDKCAIGNFVEVKNSSLGKQTKVNHLSYIGDSKIGNQVNVGAGTITCNYDGYVKSLTTIEDDVFVGSNTAIVAPVTIGKNSLIAAGSTITKDVEADDLVIARGRQVGLKGKGKEFKKAQEKKLNDKK